MKFKNILFLFGLLPTFIFAGEWLPESKIYQTEARDGTWVSVVLTDTNDLCPANRVRFQTDKWITQEAVNHYFSILLMATAADKPINIHVEIEDGNCFGRIAIVKT